MLDVLGCYILVVTWLIGVLLAVFCQWRQLYMHGATSCVWYVKSQGSGAIKERHAELIYIAENHTVLNY